MKGQEIGYIRVSSTDQNTARQLDGIRLDQVFEDRLSGKDTNRPGLLACMQYCRRGDVLHIHSMDRLARNLDDLRRIVKELTAKGVVVRFEKEGLTFADDQASPMANLLLAMLGAVAEFERAIILERQREGIAKAKVAGKYKGRAPKIRPEQYDAIRVKLDAGIPLSKVAREYNVSRMTLYRHMANKNEIVRPK